MSAECTKNAFTGVHVPGPGATCKLCGEAIAWKVAQYKGTKRAIDGAYATNDQWVAAFEAKLALLAASGRPFTSEDITADVGFYRDPGTNQNNGVGALMQKASRSGLIRKVGDTPSKIERQHGALIAVWRGSVYAS